MASNITTTAANPFLELRSVLRGRFYLAHGAEYGAQNDVLFAVTSISLVFVVVALAVRCRKQPFWLVRLTKTGAGLWITPHPNLCWLILSVVFHGLMYTYLVFEVRYGVVGSNQRTTMIWRSCGWLPLWLAGWPMLQATVLAPILSRSPNPRSRFDIARYPTIVNSVFIILPLIVLGTIIPLAAATNWHYNRAFDLFRALDADLTLAAAAFDHGVTAGDPTPLFALQAEIMVEAGFIILHWRRVWIAWTIFNGLFGLMFCTFGYAHLRHLTLSMRRLRGASGTGSSGNRQMQSLRSAYRGVVLIMTMALLICLSYTALSAIAAFRTEDLTRGEGFAEFVSLSATYIYAVLGTACNLIILARSFASPPVAHVSTATVSSGNTTVPPKHSAAESWVTKPLPVVLIVNRPRPSESNGEWMELEPKWNPLERAV